MSGQTFSDEILETNSGTVTAWLPLSTPWLSIQACSSQIYAQRAGLGANLIAFDPLYGLEISASAIPCLPSEASAWYLQTQNSLTTTLLGPTFVCPGAYSAVQTILINSQTQQILCCPSQYSLLVPLTAAHANFPSQCVSLITSGQTLAFETTVSSNSGWQPATITEQSPSQTVFGIHVNGFNVVQTSNSSPTGTPPSSTAQPQNTQITTGTSTTSSSSLRSSTETSASSSSSSPGGTGISKGAAAGIGIGAAIGVLALIAGLFFVYRRWKGRKPVQVEFKPLDPGPGPYEVDGRKHAPAPYEVEGRADLQGNSYPVHEMPTTVV